ncbi:Nicotinate phosphoribosyltransferase [compost metagenome]
MLWGERMVAHYAANRVDPRTKTLIFSDSLDIPRVIELYERFHGRCRLAFGVGTNLTNDLGYTPLQIVIKMVRCNGQPVAKLSDTPEKTMCDDVGYLSYLRQVYSVQPAA